MSHIRLTKTGRKIESATRKALLQYDLLARASGICVALSGGKDSIALLMILKCILGRGVPNLPLCAVHVTGPFSCGASVSLTRLEKFCTDWGVRLIVKNVHEDLETLSCYPCSRRRRKLIFDTAKDEGFSHVAFGHHQNDSVQTLLLNVLHKGEFSAMLPKVCFETYGVTLIRPFAYVTEEEIIAFAKVHQFMRVTCQCPVGQRSKRAEVKKILEFMQTSFPNAHTNLAQVARNHGLHKAETR